MKNIFITLFTVFLLSNTQAFSSQLKLNMVFVPASEKGDDKELFVDENWKINSKNMSNIIHSDNSNLKRILSDIFPNKKIVIQDNNDGSQTIFLS